MLTLLTALLPILNQIFGNLTSAQQDKLKLLLQEDQNLTDLMKAQADTNTQEASNPNLFVSGWRPFIGWVCACAFAWIFVVSPIIAFGCTIVHHPISLPSFDTGTLISLTFGMLGLGGFRSWEKINNVQSRH